MCFDFSNGLQEETVSRHEMTSILDWIGFSVDIASLKAFFAQKALTILAMWEALNSTVRERKHSAAFDVLLSVHLSTMDQAPWGKVAGGDYFEFSSCMKLAPMCAGTLINAYPHACNQPKLDEALRHAVEQRGPIELVTQLISAGASLKNSDCRISVDSLICYLGSRECEENELTLLKILLEAGAVVDQLHRGRFLGWVNPHKPQHATDYLLLSGEHLKHSHGLWTLVSSFSDRQQTTVTVPGIFEAAQGGQDELRSYLNSRLKPSDDKDRQMVLEIALSEASGRGHVNLVQTLVQFGVDPNGGMLPPHTRSACTMGTTPRPKETKVWHPVIRALNTGELDTIRILLASPRIDIALLDARVGEQLDLCVLRNMADSKRHQILSVLPTSDLATSSCSEILLRAVEPHRCQLPGHDVPDFGFVKELFDHSLACLGRPKYIDGETAHILVCAIMRGCGIRALSYLIERDVEVLSALSATTIGALLDATLERHDGYECQEILEFLAQNVEGFESYIREHVSSLLPYFLKERCCHFRSGCYMQHWQEECEAMVTVKWFLDLGATLKGPVLANLVPHANDSFMLALIRNVADEDAVNISGALERSIYLGRLNLAVALIERGALITGRQVGSGEPTATTLQQACQRCAPLWFIRFLVDKGADVNSPAPHKDGFTALQYAARGGLMNVAGMLLDYGADVNALSGFHRFIDPSLPFNFIRAIDLAAKYSRLDMVHFLIAAGARSCQPGRTGLEGAMKIATFRSKFAVARLLQEHADCLSGDSLEAESRWLRTNSHACLCNGRIQDAGWVAFVKRTGGNSENDFDKYMEEQSD